MQNVVILIVLLAGAGIFGLWLFADRIKRNDVARERTKLTDGTEVLIAYVACDQRFRFANKAYQQWFGKTESQIKGKTVREIVGERAFGQIEPNMEKALGGESVSFEVKLPFQGEESRHMLATYKPDIDAHGVVQGVVVSVTETTQTKQLERYLDGVLMNLPVGVAILEGPEFRYFRVNQALADLNGVPLEEHLGRPLAQVIPEAAQELLPILRPILATGQPVLGREFSIRLPAAPERTRHLMDFLFPIDGSDGRTQAVGAVVVDVTERKELEEQLAQAQKMESFGTLAGGIAHDFNNVLVAIMGHTELLKDDVGANEDLAAIETAARHAAQLTERLLAFARQQPRHVQVIDLSDSLQKTEKVLRRLLESNIELVVVPAHAPCRVRIDPGQLGQVIMNLALNSRDAMPNGGKLTMAVERVEKDGMPEAVLSVADTGVGMSEPQRHNMFDPFFTTKEVGKGTGLGLAMCYGIVEQSDGYFDVESAPGEGTTIRVYFPVVDEALETASPAATERTTGTETILLVEDEAAVRALAAKGLRRSGYTVLEAGDGEEALSILHEKGASIDAMITDMVMPRMGGRALIERMREPYPAVRILCTSGYADRDDVRTPAIAALPLLQKPYPPSVLLRKIRALLDGDPL